MTLYIDGTDYNSVTYALGGKDGIVVSKKYNIDPHQSHRTLQYLDTFLNSKKFKTADIKKIVVSKGPGSFTGTRISIAHAMALGLAWGVPVKAVSREKFVIR